MINELYLRILNFIIFLVDHKNKIKIINYFKKNTPGNLTLIDVGAHKGETITLANLRKMLIASILLLEIKMRLKH